jgi:hypothetical protein
MAVLVDDEVLLAVMLVHLRSLWIACQESNCSREGAGTAISDADAA